MTKRAAGTDERRGALLLITHIGIRVWRARKRDQIHAA